MDLQDPTADQVVRDVAEPVPDGLVRVWTIRPASSRTKTKSPIVSKKLRRFRSLWRSSSSALLRSVTSVTIARMPEKLPSGERTGLLARCIQTSDPSFLR